MTSVASVKAMIASSTARRRPRPGLSYPGPAGAVEMRRRKTYDAAASGDECSIRRQTFPDGSEEGGIVDATHRLNMALKRMETQLARA